MSIDKHSKISIRNSFLNTQLDDSNIISSIDYKAKTFMLMKKISQMQITQKKQKVLIEKLQKSISIMNCEIQTFLKMTSADSLNEVVAMFKQQSKNNKNHNNSNINEQFTKIISQYKLIIDNQKYKYAKIQNQLRITNIKLAKLQEQQSEINNREFKLKEQIKILKNQYKELILKNDELKQLKNQIQKKYHAEIEHFQSLEKCVQEKLKAVEEQMTQYHVEREQQLYKIKMLEKELQARQLKQYFSFGGKQSKQIQVQQNMEDILNIDKQQQNENIQINKIDKQDTIKKKSVFKRTNSNSDEEITQENFSKQCFEASIKTLLQENKRLKNALVLLYHHKDKQIPQQAQIELKILMSLEDNQQI